MFTDMVGFTRLAQQDERRALRLLEDHRSLLRPIFVSRGGREVKTIGDGFMVEFASAVESARCAVEIQTAIRERNSVRPRAEQFHVRVGIHVGDVVRQGDDLVGDGVNVAARIEPLAPPGGICISGPVWEQIRNKVDIHIRKTSSNLAEECLPSGRRVQSPMSSGLRFHLSRTNFLSDRCHRYDVECGGIQPTRAFDAIRTNAGYSSDCSPTSTRLPGRTLSGG